MFYEKFSVMQLSGVSMYLPAGAASISSPLHSSNTVVSDTLETAGC